MAAHSVKIETAGCIAPGCDKRATHMVKTTYNAELGAHCKNHADIFVKRLQTADDAEWRDIHCPDTAVRIPPYARNVKP